MAAHTNINAQQVLTHAVPMRHPNLRQSQFARHPRGASGMIRWQLPSARRFQGDTCQATAIRIAMIADARASTAISALNEDDKRAEREPGHDIACEKQTDRAVSPVPQTVKRGLSDLGNHEREHHRDHHQEPHHQVGGRRLV